MLEPEKLQQLLGELKGQENTRMKLYWINQRLWFLLRDVAHMSHNNPEKTKFLIAGKKFNPLGDTLPKLNKQAVLASKRTFFRESSNLIMEHAVLCAFYYLISLEEQQVKLTKVPGAMNELLKPMLQFTKQVLDTKREAVKKIYKNSFNMLALGYLFSTLTPILLLFFPVKLVLTIMLAAIPLSMALIGYLISSFVHQRQYAAADYKKLLKDTEAFKESLLQNSATKLTPQERDSLQLGIYESVLTKQSIFNATATPNTTAENTAASPAR